MIFTLGRMGLDFSGIYYAYLRYKSDKQKRERQARLDALRKESRQWEKPKPKSW